MTDREKIHGEFWASLDALVEVEKLRQSVNTNQSQHDLIENLFLFSMMRLEDVLKVYSKILREK